VKNFIKNLSTRLKKAFTPVHKCDAIVVVCIDFRFQDFLHEWLDKKMKDKTYDLVGYAGATKELKVVMKQIDISVKLHHIKQVILIHHEDCGAYGEKGIYDRHLKDLKKAEKAILTKYPKLEIELYYLNLDGKFEVVI